MECPTCGRQCDAEDKFCRECGTALKETVGGTETVGEMLAEYASRASEEPADADAQYNLGLACFYQQQFERAASAFQAVIELAPDFVDAHLRHAACLAQLGRREEAIAALERAAELAPEDEKVREALARLRT
ncbi:MAG: tetratricopeptide repeat protein [Armatimonadota bacterium]